MASPSDTLPAGVQAATPATSVVSANQRVKSGTGALGVATDQVFFSPPSVLGMWILPDLRCSVGGVPTIGSASIGTATNVDGSVVPMQVTQGDSRVETT